MSILEYIYSPHYEFYIDKAEREHGFNMPMFHIHHKYEIYYAVNGTRRYFIEDSAYTVNSGDLILIGVNQPHKTESVGDTPSSRIVLNFSDDYLSEIYQTFPNVDFSSFLNTCNHLLTGLTTQQQFSISHVLHRLLLLEEHEDDAAKAESRLLFASFLLLLKELVESKVQANVPATNINPIVVEAQKYIVEHYAEELTLQSVANALFISPYHLSRLFRKHVGIGIIEYVKSIRIKKAQEFLLTKNLSISIIGEISGFNSAANFRRVFKEITGYTPQKYRQQFREK